MSDGKCWLVLEPHPGEDFRSTGGARGVPRLTIHFATEVEAAEIAKLLASVVLNGTPTQVGFHPLENCQVCDAPDDDVTQPPKRKVTILTPKDWVPTSPEVT